MKQLAMTVVLTLVFGLAALAQSSTPSDPQSGAPGTPSAAPSASPSSQQPSAEPSAAPSAGSSQTSDTSSASKGEKKLKGCIQSENGKYTLQEKNGKSVELTGQDVAAHVGHTVTVHGTMSAASGSSASNLPAGTGTPSASGGGEQFNVTKIDMVSESCTLEKGKSSDKSKSPTEQK